MAAAILFNICVPLAPAQSAGSILGTVSLASGERLHTAIILIPQLSRRAESDDHGNFRFINVPPGTYAVVARASGFGDERRTVTVAAGKPASVDFKLKLAAVREEITVTASGREETAYESFQAVSTLNSIELVKEAEPSIGEVLDNEPGVAKRSFGPGSARPVIRGFDGDRVLVMRDGMPTGALSSQSGDHGEPINVLGLERLEVVKGPATLLYGSSALGGVVNAITPNEHFQEHSHDGMTGYVSGTGGSTNDSGGVDAGLQAGFGTWAFWANGGANRTDDYRTPIGRVENSGTRSADLTAGAGWLGNRSFFNLSGNHIDSRYGIPFAGAFEESPDGEQADIDVAMRRWNVRSTAGYKNLGGPLPDFRLMLDYNDYRHDEIEVDDGTESLGTRFTNRLFNYRGVFTQKQAGVLSGSFGFSGATRMYKATGPEALSSPVDQMSFAVFALEQIALPRIGFQFGGRVESNRYDAQQGLDRDFTGFSGAAGVRVPLWTGGAFVANYTHSYRAPALEELYNFGPHLGNLAFEIGNSALQRELSNGLDLSLRHSTNTLRVEANFFLYRIGNFVFLAPTHAIREGLMEAEYMQGDSRFMGSEVTADVSLHPNLWLNLGFDVVNAELNRTVTSANTGAMAAAGTPLPRIPPMRGRIGVDARFKGLSINPNVVIADAAEDLFPTETRTAGYTVVNLDASYTLPAKHTVHVFSVKAFNLGDRLYRNHLSFIKELAPEIGRGVRVGYTVRFF